MARPRISKKLPDPGLKPYPDIELNPPVDALDNKWRLFECTCCGRQFKQRNGNFTKCSSVLYQANDKFLPVCDSCLEELLNHYKQRFGDTEQAIARVCLHFDIYFDIELLESCNPTNDILNLFKDYCRRCMMPSRDGKRTYDEYLYDRGDIPEYVRDVNHANREGELSDEVIERWGKGIFTKEDYDTLETHYQMLKRQNPNCDSNQEIFIKDLCLTKWQQMQAIATHNINDYQKLTQLYQDTFAKAGLKVGQEAIEGGNETLGVTLETISHYTPEEYYQDKKLYKDFDGLGEYLSRFIFRPIKNQILGTKKRDKEYSIPEDTDAD